MDLGHYGRMAKAHWEEFHPVMARRLHMRGILDQLAKEVGDQVSEMMVDLISKKGLKHHEAWEHARELIVCPAPEPGENPSNSEF